MTANPEMEPALNHELAPEPAPEPAPVFDLGLVMAGAVSAGAYTGGALDFFFEALDAWTDLQQLETGLPLAERTAPPHGVRFKVVAGASAGSMCAAMIGIAKHYRFPHIREGSSEADRATNPFYRCWVREVDIRSMLGTEDLDRDKTVHSFLNSDRLPVILDWLLNYRGTPVTRTYFADPLCFRFTVGNLRGVPYRLTYRGNTTGAFDTLMHGDYMGFVMGTGAGFPGHLPLQMPNSPTDQGWVTYGRSALASGAFPLALRARGLSRPPSDYDSRLSDTTRPISPAWPGGDAEPYRFLCVDGGVMNNEPFNLAHEVLAEHPTQSLLRDGAEASKAVLMVDPFVDPFSFGPEAETPALKTLMPLLSAWKTQCRFKASDLSLAWDESIFSRFLLAPSRGQGAQTVSHPLAAGGLGGFLGFFHESFRHHDFLLGRRNAQQFLSQHFCLPETNPLFSGWTQAMKSQYRIQGPGGPFLPIIPLMGPLQSKEEPLPAWPSGKLNRDELKAPIKARLEAVQKVLLKDLDLGFWTRLYVGIGWLASKGKLVNAVMDKIHTSLDEQRL